MIYDRCYFALFHADFFNIAFQPQNLSEMFTTVTDKMERTPLKNVTILNELQ